MRQCRMLHVALKVASVELETLASILGPNQVFFLSQDDKARVPIGLTAANKQASLLMHVEYRVSLPDRLGDCYEAQIDP